MAKKEIAKPAEEKKTAKKRAKKDVEEELIETSPEVDTEPEDEAVDEKPEAAPQEEPEISKKRIDSRAALLAEKAPELPEKKDVTSNSSDIPRYDLIITSERAGYRPPKAAVYSMVRMLALRGFANPVDEAVAETWTEIYFEPGPAAHEIFIERSYSSKAPVYHEIHLKFTEKPFFCDYTDTPNRPLYFAIEIYGSRFNVTTGAFKKLFLDALNLRVTVNSKKAGEIPEHKVVSEEEKPIEKKKNSHGNGVAGTAVVEI